MIEVSSSSSSEGGDGGMRLIEEGNGVMIGLLLGRGLIGEYLSSKMHGLSNPLRGE